MKIEWRLVGGAIFLWLLTGVVAWAGQKWISGFDIRGPFLLMSPMFAFCLFLAIIFWVMTRHGVHEPADGPTASDHNLANSVAIEFGFGPVTFVKNTMLEQGSWGIAMAKDRGIPLPTHWLTFGTEEKRFAVVRSLAARRRSRVRWLLDATFKYGGYVAAMVASGLNLWLILGIQTGFAATAGATAHSRAERSAIRMDLIGLRVMRNLKAAIAFVKAEELSKVPKGKAGYAKHIAESEAGKRIAALRAEALKLGIA